MILFQNNAHYVCNFFYTLGVTSKEEITSGTQLIIFMIY